MKRSIMIKRLGKFLDKQGITDDSSAASLILKEIERLGMLPPETHIKSRRGHCLCGHFESCEYCSTLGIERNEWEEE